MVVIGGFSGIMEDNALLFSPGELTCPMSYTSVLTDPVEISGTLCPI